MTGLEEWRERAFAASNEAEKNIRLAGIALGFLLVSLLVNGILIIRLMQR